MNSDAPTPFDGAVVLQDLALIHAHGTDAASFLQGQLTNDVLGLSPDQARLAALCNAQGRMLATFVVAWRPSAGDSTTATAGSLWLTVSTDLQAAMLKRLKMYVLRAKAVLDDGAASSCVIGLAGPSALNWLGDAGARLAPWAQTVRDGAAIVRLPDALGVPRWLWMGERARLPDLQGLPVMSDVAWQWLKVHSGVVDIVEASSVRLVPQMLNYEVIGGVSFRKGCYPGQEVVARSQYLGKLKRRSFLLSADLPLDMRAAGRDVFWSGDPGQPAGMVVAAATEPVLDKGSVLLAELKLAATESGTLHLDAPDGPALGLLELPYEVPAPDAPKRPL